MLEKPFDTLRTGGKGEKGNCPSSFDIPFSLFSPV
jgi:hypothetical protein